LKKSYFTTFVSVQIYKLYGYGQYKIHGDVIDVLENVNQIQSILPCLPNDDATIDVFLKHLIYKSSYISKNVCPNILNSVSQYLIETPL
jgi:hypothetical protein